MQTLLQPSIPTIPKVFGWLLVLAGSFFAYIYMFSPGSFFKELAVGTGAGIRIDVQFFVLRFDYAIPLRDPTGKKVDIKSGRLNLAIGYPF